jgi:L-lactate dehydrogenase complex protein LldG
VAGIGAAVTGAAARDEVLARVRMAVAGTELVEPVRRYRGASSDPADIELFADRLRDYRADVVRCGTAGLAEAIGTALTRAGATMVVVPPGLAAVDWPSTVPMVVDDGSITPAQLDGPGVVVVTTCAVAIAQTGTLVLDGTHGQGRRLLTLVPDHHICLVPEERVVLDVPEAIARLDATRPLTWISGPSATSDIELQRVEGVHGPRHLTAIIVTASVT